MSLAAAIRFREQINSDTALQARARELITPGASFEVSIVARALGFSFSQADAERAFVSPDSDELSDFELEMVQSAVPVYCGDGSGTQMN